MNEQQKSMYFIYIDESYDKTHFCYSCLLSSAFHWNHIFGEILKWRKSLKDKYNIPLEYELHATKFISGSGEPHQNRNKDFRAKVFNESFNFFNKLPHSYIINGITNNKMNHMKLFSCLLSEIEAFLLRKNAYGVLICDEGNEKKLISMVRKRRKNSFSSGQKLVSPVKRIIEDPLFKPSTSSYFIQITDFVAFSFLRSQNPTQTTRKLVEQSFESLDEILIKNNLKKKGIIRA